MIFQYIKEFYKKDEELFEKALHLFIISLATFSSKPPLLKSHG